MKLKDMAKTIRSKNAGVAHITFDIIFPDTVSYEIAKNSGVLTPEKIASLYGIELDDIVCFIFFDPARALKFSLKRIRRSGGPGDPDVFGSQQYGPLFDIEIRP